MDALNDPNGVGTARFSYTDGSTDNLDFIRGPVGQLPWAPGEPNDIGDLIEDCVE